MKACVLCVLISGASLFSVQAQSGSNALEITGLGVSAVDAGVTIAATNTTAITRYALQSSSSLTGMWSGVQHRLARTGSLSFFADMPGSAPVAYYRIAEDPYQTRLLSGSFMNVSLFCQDYDLESAWTVANVSYDTVGTGTYTVVEHTYSYPPDASNQYFSATIYEDGSYEDTDEFYGLLSLDQNLLALVSADEGGEAGLDLLLRTGGSGFSTSDLEGVWELFMLSVQSTNGGYAGWEFGEAVFGATGSSSWSPTQRSDGGSSTLTPGLFSVAVDGTVTSGFAGPGMMDQWQLALDADLMAFVMAENQHDQVNLGVMMRTGGTGYSTADLEGRWHLLMISAADSPGDWVGYLEAGLDFTASGAASWSSVFRSDGDSSLPPSFTLSVADDGSISGGPPGPDWQMSRDKDLIMFVGDDGGGGINLGLLLRN